MGIIQFLLEKIKIDVMEKDTYMKRGKESHSLHVLVESSSGWVTKLFA